MHRSADELGPARMSAGCATTRSAGAEYCGRFRGTNPVHSTSSGGVDADGGGTLGSSKRVEASGSLPISCFSQHPSPMRGP
jgi:hypothetical protein